MYQIAYVVLERIVFEAICGLAEFVKCHETVFLYMLAKKNNAMRQKEYRKLQQTVEQDNRRISEIDRLIEKVFEQNATGVLSDERFTKMLRNYEKEQKDLLKEVAESQQTLENASKGDGFKTFTPYTARNDGDKGTYPDTRKLADRAN